MSYKCAEFLSWVFKDGFLQNPTSTCRTKHTFVLSFQRRKNSRVPRTLDLARAVLPSHSASLVISSSYAPVALLARRR